MSLTKASRIEPDVAPTVWAFAEEHIARHDPAHVLAQCEAMRRIVEEHAPVDPCDAHDAVGHSEPCPTLRALAAIWSDHPDHNPAWQA